MLKVKELKCKNKPKIFYQFVYSGVAVSYLAILFTGAYVLSV